MSWGEEGRSKRTRSEGIPQTPLLSGLRKLRAACGGLLLLAGGRRQRLRFAGSRSAARDLPPGTSKRECQGRFANSRREWMQGGGGERARRREGKGRSRAGELGWPPPREESERAAGAGGAAAAAEEAARAGGRRRGRPKLGGCALRGAAVAGSVRLRRARGRTAEPASPPAELELGGAPAHPGRVPQGTPLHAAN